ncbi:hypothetical protein SBDP1_490042 [Syntrophobacter sp. SbD1]|nr:hypothetical protein SBDP1_490042 [Syntrophobacter sp. SbD1]
MVDEMELSEARFALEFCGVPLVEEGIEIPA